MPEKDLINFLKKIEQLNKITELIEKDPIKKKELSDCKNHEDVINLTSKWGFEIGKRWGEYWVWFSLIVLLDPLLKDKYQ